MQHSLVSRTNLTDLALSDLAWFEGDDAGDDSGLGCNRDYRDLRGKSWVDVRRVLECERHLIGELKARGWASDEDGDGPEVEGLGLGVAAAVTALSALGCTPFTSCNGGAFGGEHEADRLIVGFYARPEHCQALEEVCLAVQTKLHGEHGALWIKANVPEGMLDWAERLLKHARLVGSRLVAALWDVHSGHLPAPSVCGDPIGVSHRRA